MSGHRDRKIQCPCKSCVSMGGRSVMTSTATEHLQMQNAVERILRQFDGRELDENEAQEDLVVDESDNECNDQTGEEDLEDGWEAQDVEPQYSRETHGDKEIVTSEEAILNQIIYIQSVCDKHGASISLQDFLMHQFVGGFSSQSAAGREFDFNQQLLGLLMSQLPNGWDGTLEGCGLPDSWRKLMDLYSKLGMVLPERWRLCVGTIENAHEEVVLRPSKEDSYRFWPNPTMQHPWSEFTRLPRML